ncbi:hypothetical protein AM218_11310 [Hymenobacter sp. DG25A]|nr:hypothetical protein AM218_11310 [Hymenobacter sp. DG25A]
MNIVIEIITMTLLAYPGAFILWILNGFKTPYSILIKDDIWYNSLFSLILIIIYLIINQYFIHVF